MEGIESLPSVGLVYKAWKEAYETEHHFHGHEKWFGDAAASVAETHHADRIGASIGPFALVSGNDAYNATWTQILGSSDTPVESGKLKYDLHRILVTGTDDTNVFAIQFVEGENADIAAKISAEDFTEVMYVASANQFDSGIETFMQKRIDAGTKLWARCICITANAKTISIYLGLHEYDL